MSETAKEWMDTERGGRMPTVAVSELAGAAY
jgi:hypothetical protein